MNKFPQRLKEVRIKRNLSQQQLADMLAVHQQTVSNWEQNTRKPDLDMLLKIAEILEVPTDYLLGAVD